MSEPKGVAGRAIRLLVCRRGHTDWTVAPSGKRRCVTCHRDRMRTWRKKRGHDASSAAMEGDAVGASDVCGDAEVVVAGEWGDAV
jgi:hypothetical protein